jgi:hypothetical protein
VIYAMSSEGRLRKLGFSCILIDIYMAFLAQLVPGQAIVFELNIYSLYQPPAG